MKPIINIPNLLEYEHISSYVERLYLANGFSNLKEFKNAIGYNNLRIPTFHENHRFKPLFEYLNPASWAEFYLNTTIYHFIAPLVSSGKQVTWLSTPFDLRPVHGNKYNLSLIKRCPKCDEQLSYVRTFHNIPGVNVCCIHECSLEIDGVPVVKEISQEEIDYAKFAKEFMDCKFDTDKNRLLKKIKCSFVGYSEYKKKILRIMAKHKNIKTVAIETSKPMPNDDDYDFLFVSNIIIEAIHKKCGTRFCTTFYGFENGFLCPTCQATLSKDELMKEHIQISSNGEYAYKGNIGSLNSNMEFTHSCGKKFKMTPYSYLEGTRCNCERWWTEESLPIYLANNFPEYKYISKDGDKYIFEHNCGTIFKSSKTNFLKRNIQCPKCNQYYWNEELAKEFVENNGFIYISGFEDVRSTITIRCVRGHTVDVTFKRFKAHPVCKKCSIINQYKNSNTANVLDYILKNYSKNDIIYCKDIVKGFNGDKSVYSAIRNLLDTGRLYSISESIYTLKADMSFDEAVEKIYFTNKEESYLSGAFLLSEEERMAANGKYVIYTSKVKNKGSRKIKGVLVQVKPLEARKGKNVSF